MKKLKAIMHVSNSTFTFASREAWMKFARTSTDEELSNIRIIKLNFVFDHDDDELFATSPVFNKMPQLKTVVKYMTNVLKENFFRHVAHSALSPIYKYCRDMNEETEAEMRKFVMDMFYDASEYGTVSNMIIVEENFHVNVFCSEMYEYRQFFTKNNEYTPLPVFYSIFSGRFIDDVECIEYPLVSRHVREVQAS